jgi:hypothetical protein
MVASIGRAQSWALSSGTVEALKWFAFVCMVVDHANTIWLGRSEAWMYAVGRIAMPIFAVVFGYNVVRSRDPQAVIRRLLVIGVLVQPVAMLTINRGELLPGNILLTFAAGALLWQMIEARRWVVAWVLLVASGLVVDYSVVGVALVAVSAAYFQHRAKGYLFLAGGLSVALCVMNGNLWALVGFAVVMAAGWVPLTVPRLRWAFLAAYPAHMLALAWMG